MSGGRDQERDLRRKISGERAQERSQKRSQERLVSKDSSRESQRISSRERAQKKKFKRGRLEEPCPVGACLNKIFQYPQMYTYNLGNLFLLDTPMITCAGIRMPLLALTY